MKKMNNLELSSFKIISSVGMAKSSYIEAMNAAEKGNFDLADEKIKEGEKFFSEGHEAHSGLIQQESSGDDIKLSLLLMHAEDQLMSAETIKIMAKEVIKLNNRIQNL